MLVRAIRNALVNVSVRASTVEVEAALNSMAKKMGWDGWDGRFRYDNVKEEPHAGERKAQ